MTEQQRVPQGDPRGGQFTSQSRPESDPEVLDSVYREDEGSFVYPPVLKTYDQAMKFWSTVPIPESNLAKFEVAYQKNCRFHLNKGLTRWEEQNPRPSGRGAAAWDEARAQVERELVARNPKMFASWVRPLARLDRLWVFRGSLHKADLEKLTTKQFALPGGPRGTCEEIITRFRTREYNNVLRETEIHDQIRLEDLLRENNLYQQNRY